MVYDLVNHVAYVYTNKQESMRKVLTLDADIRIQEGQLSFPVTPLENPRYWAASQLRLHLLRHYHYSLGKELREVLEVKHGLQRNDDSVLS